MTSTRTYFEFCTKRLSHGMPLISRRKFESFDKENTGELTKCQNLICGKRKS